MQFLNHLGVIAGVLLLTRIDASSNSFYYNGDVECTYPFSGFSITGISCMGSSYTYVSGYNDQDDMNFYDDEAVCSFGDTMSVQGTANMDGMSAKKFTVMLKVCFGGSMYVGYNPQTCKSYRSTLDLTDYARLKEADFYDEELDENDYYLQAGQYEWQAGFKIPKKTFTFLSGSTVQVYVTLIPYSSYPDYPYYGNNPGQSYNAAIYDSKTRSTCYASFSAVNDENDMGMYGSYYRVAAGILLLGVATIVTAKRKVICAPCGNRADADDDDDQPKYVREQGDGTNSIAATL